MFGSLSDRVRYDVIIAELDDLFSSIADEHQCDLVVYSTSCLY